MSSTVIIKDKNLKPENIKKGVKILKTEGTYEGGGSSANLGKLVETVTDNTRYVFDASDYGKDGFNAVIIDVSVASSGGADPLLISIGYTPEEDSYVVNDGGFIMEYEDYDGMGSTTFGLTVISNEEPEVEIDGDIATPDSSNGMMYEYSWTVEAEPGDSFQSFVTVTTASYSQDLEFDYHNMSEPEPSGEPCPQCGGTGTDPNTGEMCEMCGGSGYLPTD